MADAPKLSAVPTHEELEAAAAEAGEVHVVGGALIAGGVRFGTYRDGKVVADEALAQHVDFQTGKVLRPRVPIEGASTYVAEGKEPVKLAAKRAARSHKKTQEEIDKANAMSEEEEAAQVEAEEAAANPPPAEAPAPAPAPSPAPAP